MLLLVGDKLSNIILGLIVTGLILITATALFSAGLRGANVIGTSFDSSTDRDYQQSRTWLTGPTPLPTPGYLSLSAYPQPFDITFTNTGEEDISSDFPDWDIIWELRTASGLQINRLAYTSSTPAANEWAISGIYQDADSLTSEVFDPGVINKGEDLIISINPDPAVEGTHWARLSVAVSNGVTAKSIFEVFAPTPSPTATPAPTSTPSPTSTPRTLAPCVTSSAGAPALSPCELASTPAFGNSSTRMVSTIIRATAWCA